MWCEPVDGRGVEIGRTSQATLTLKRHGVAPKRGPASQSSNQVLNYDIAQESMTSQAVYQQRKGVV